MSESEMYLAHHGRKDQRWGYQNGPPYPLDREGLASFRAQKKHFDELEKRENSSNSHSEHEKSYEKPIKKKKKLQLLGVNSRKKKKAINEGNLKYIKKHADKFTDQEIEMAIKKYTSKQKIQMIMDRNQSIINGINARGKKIEATENKVRNVVKLGKDFVDGYNLVANVYNTFKSDDKEPMKNIKNVGNNNSPKKVKVRHSDDLRVERFLEHHGVKGQEWGERNGPPYPLNKEGKAALKAQKKLQKRIASNKKTEIPEGSTLYRISSQNKTDASDDKLYVTTNKEASDFYKANFAITNAYDKGKAFYHEYVSKTKIVMPDKKTMEKIELGLLKDKEIQKEIIDSLMKKGRSREEATKIAKPYSAGKAFVQRVGSATLAALVLPMSPLATAGAAANVVLPPEKRRALDTVRISYGDKNNKVLNKKLSSELEKRGYNAMKDYNDRRAFGKNGNHSIVVFNSKNNAKKTKSIQISASEYGKAYAKNYLKEHPKSKLNFDDLVKDGEKLYKNTIDDGVITRARYEENKQILKNAKSKKS